MTATAAAASSRLTYEVAREHDATTDRFRVTLHFRGHASGTTILRLPGQWAGAQHAERGIEQLTVTTPDARLEPTDKPDAMRIIHRPGAALTVRYALRQIANGEPRADAPTPYLPVIRPGYFAWIGWTSWVFPETTAKRVSVSVAFTNLPDDWTYASSFGVDARHTVTAGRLEDFRSAIFVGGDFRLRSRRVRGGHLITAVRGDWAMRDSQLADRVAMIVDGERAFWRDDRQPYFLVVLTPLEAKPSWRSITGTGLSQSFAAFVSDRTSLEDLDFLWTHEYFHNWNSRALGHFEEPQARLYWFSEGFTDYYMDLLQLRWGMKTLEQYAQIYDGKLRRLAESPVAHALNAEVASQFFSSEQIGRLPYLRGQLLAAQWDAQIRAASNDRRSLDDVMRGLRDESQRGTNFLDEKRIVERARLEGVADPAGDVARQIERGEPAPFEDGVLTACIAIEDVTEARFDWGFDYDTTIQGNPISGVRVDGPAYAAGVRDGQWLRTAKGGRTTTTMVEVGVQDLPDETVRTLRYPPTGAPVTRRTASLKPGLTDSQRSGCLRELGVTPSSQVTSASPSQATP